MTNSVVCDTLAVGESLKRGREGGREGRGREGGERVREGEGGKRRERKTLIRYKERINDSYQTLEAWAV